MTIAIAVAAAAAGWLAGRNITSPDQAALESEAPPASLITVEVELAELSADVIIRADVGYDEPTTLGLSGALGNRDSALVVTSAPERGAELIEGSVAIEIAGQPVFVLVGPVPVYRDLRPQDRGPDVEQLEAALARLGYFEGDPDQLWDGATGAAVSAWYEQAGYRANGPSDTEQAALEAARDRLDTARDALADAQRALADASEGPTELELQQARTAVAQAESALDQARRALAQVTTDAQQAVVDARQRLADAKQAVTAAELALASEELVRNRAADNLTQAQMRRQSALSGVHPDSGAVPTAVEHEALRAAVSEAENALSVAEQDVADARRAVVDATWAVTDAEEELTEAQEDLQELQQTTDGLQGLQVPGDVEDSGGLQVSGDVEDSGGLQVPGDVEDSGGVEDSEPARPATQAQLDVRTAEDHLAAVQETLADLLAEPDTTDAVRVVESARSELRDATEDLVELEATTGVWLPAGELIFLKRLPVRVDLLTAERGSTVSGSFMTVTGSELAVRGSVSERDVDRVSEGMQIRIEDRSLEAPVTGTIRLLDRRAGTRGVAPDRHYVEIVAQGIPDHLVGRNVKIVIPVGGTEGPVLVVPNAALSATASGSTRVEVEQPDGTTRFVSVEPGLSTGGRAEVTPVDGELKAGDLVVVGVASGE